MGKRYFEVRLSICNYDEKFYYNEGVICIEDDGTFEGYAAYDYINGVYSNGILIIELYQCDFIGGYFYNMFQNSEIEFELPGIFYLKDVDSDYVTMRLEVTKKLSCIENFSENIMEAKEINCI